MTEKESSAIELSRRKALAGMGTIGVAAAGAGLGTSAFFSDQETFTNNRLVAGSLDLKVDWEEHYSDWSEDESDGLQNDVVMTKGDPTMVPQGYVGLPDPSAPLIAVAQGDLGQFMDNTSIEAFPDFDGDGTQDAGDEEEPYVPCRDGADTPEDLDPTQSFRTENLDTYAEGPLPLINLEDVKPGDFGELTLSFHLCDNPGYVWLQADNVSQSENGLTEPEAKDPDEVAGEVELASAIQTAWWYDTDGDNVIDEVQGQVDVMVCLDRSGSLNTAEGNALSNAANDLVDGLLAAGDVQVGGLTFAGGVNIVQTLGTTNFSFPTGSGNGTTAMPPALDFADQHLDNVGRAGAEQVIVLLTDGGPNYSNVVYNAGGMAAPRANNWSADAADQAYDNGNTSGTSSGELDETELVANNIKGPAGDGTGDASRIVTVGVGDPLNVGGSTLDEFLRDRIASSTADHYNANFDNVNDIINDVVVGVAFGEQVFRRGTLASDLAALSTANGIPLDGDLTTDYDEIAGIGNETDEEIGERECFAPSTTYHIGFAWWLPVDHANEIQTDSVQFDLGFYTEQCRHNDGAGMANTEG